MTRSIFLCVVIFFATLFLLSQASASILLSEILADPPTGILGDANGDGIYSSDGDEFVELVNTAASPVSIAGWWLSDAVRVRHVFPSSSSIDPYSYFVIFGGGMPTSTTFDWQKASTGTLSLNNTGDTVSLFTDTGVLVEQVKYGASVSDQSLARVQYVAHDLRFVAHTAQTPGKLFSPGSGLVTAPVNSTTVPDAATWVQIVSGLLALGWGRGRFGPRSAR